MSDKIENQRLSDKQNLFREKYKDFSDRDMMIELLLAQSIQIDKLERNRSNTSKIVWFFIGIPIILVILAFFTGLLGAAFMPLI